MIQTINNDSLAEGLAADDVERAWDDITLDYLVLWESPEKREQCLL